MERNAKATCSTCPYWDQYSRYPEKGGCRRAAPADFYFQTGWPEMSEEDWCGEHPEFLGPRLAPISIKPPKQKGDTECRNSG